MADRGPANPKKRWAKSERHTCCFVAGVKPAMHPAFALIVSRNIQTSESLRRYFDERGVTTAVTDELWPGTEHRDQVSAVVVFPDEFSTHDAPQAISKLVRGFSRAWVVVVTRDTARFDPLVATTKSVGRVLVLPRPVWGWALLDRVLQPLPRSAIKGQGGTEKK